MLRNGTIAPDFTLTAASGEPVNLSKLRGEKPTILAFFRFCECPTSRRDLIRYANVYSRIKSIGAELIGISVESPAEHKTLADQMYIGFELLSDPGMMVSDQYGVYRSDEEDGPQPHGEPAVFIIDVDGKIAYSQVQTGPKGAADPSEMALILLYMSQNGGRY